MQKVTHSEYIAQKKPLAKQLLAKLNEKYQYASVLITDNYEKVIVHREAALQFPQQTHSAARA